MNNSCLVPHDLGVVHVFLKPFDVHQAASQAFSPMAGGTPGLTSVIVWFLPIARRYIDHMLSWFPTC